MATLNTQNANITLWLHQTVNLGAPCASDSSCETNTFVFVDSIINSCSAIKANVDDLLCAWNASFRFTPQCQCTASCQCQFHCTRHKHFHVIFFQFDFLAKCWHEEHIFSAFSQIMHNHLSNNLNIWRRNVSKCDELLSRSKTANFEWIECFSFARRHSTFELLRQMLQSMPAKSTASRETNEKSLQASRRTCDENALP